MIYNPSFEGTHPLLVAQYASSLYAHYFESGDPDSIEAFWPQARWLRDNFVQVGEFGVWQYPFDYKPFEAEAPWVSAFMQAFGLSVMLKAAALAPERTDAYESVANLALQAFEVPVEDGGVHSTWDDGTVWYEEYATSVDSHVLNGFIFALSGLYEYWQQTSDGQAAELFAQGVEALESKLTEFDKGFTSAYGVYYYGNAQGNGGYHTIHIKQLLWVYWVTGNPFFWEKASRWVNYDSSLHPEGPFVADVDASFEPDDPTFAASNLIDNLAYGGYWSSWHLPVTIDLDLGRVERDVSQIVLFTVSEQNAPGTFTVELSSDGATWMTGLIVADGEPAAAIRGQHKGRTASTEVYGYPLETPGDARYLRITIATDRGAGLVALREIMVHFDQSAHTQEIYEELLSQFDRGRVP